ncbi:MAG: FMN-binding protein [Tepidanaerobacteraceae bacterium]
MKNRIYLVTVGILVILLIVGCSSPDGMTKKEVGALKELIPNFDEQDIEQISLTDDIDDKFPAVKKAFKVKNGDKHDYIFMVAPVGYRGPINIITVIDGKQNTIANLRIVQHDETPIYAEKLTENWFLDRFTGKSVNKYLRRVRLEATKPNEIIQITACTVSTQAVINGVNSAMGVYCELVLKESCEPVPLKVEEFVTGVE